MPELIRPTSGQGKVVEVDDIRIYFDDQGAGDPVVLLHGGLMDHQSWGNQIPELSEHFRVISPDTRGHGRTTDSMKPLTYRRFADDVAGLLSSLDVPRAHLVGFSDGGCTALLLSLHYPHLVDRLVLLGTPYNVSNYPAGTADVYATFSPEQFYEVNDPDSHVVETVRKAQRLYPSDEAWRAFWAKLVNDLWPHEPNLDLADLARVQAPTLILHAENEQFFAREHSEEMARVMPNATLRYVPDATHMAAQENPEFVNPAITSFLN